MNTMKMLKEIERRKKILNFLLLFLPPTCTIMVKLSQNLDLYIHKYQSYLARKYNAKSLKHYNSLKENAA